MKFNKAVQEKEFVEREIAELKRQKESLYHSALELDGETKSL